MLCSSRKRLRNDDDNSVEKQSHGHPSSSDHVPKTPRCSDRLE